MLNRNDRKFMSDIHRYDKSQRVGERPTPENLASQLFRSFRPHQFQDVKNRLLRFFESHFEVKCADSVSRQVTISSRPANGLNMHRHAELPCSSTELELAYCTVAYADNTI
jgi:hypothetical protein